MQLMIKLDLYFMNRDFKFHKTAVFWDKSVKLTYSIR